MPAIKLNKEEIRLLSIFVAELHKATHGEALKEGADTTCPVCKANVSSEKAKEASLWFTYLDETFSFECDQMQRAFFRAAGSLSRVMQLRQHHESTR